MEEIINRDGDKIAKVGFCKTCGKKDLISYTSNLCADCVLKKWGLEL